MVCYNRCAVRNSEDHTSACSHYNYIVTSHNQGTCSIVWDIILGSEEEQIYGNFKIIPIECNSLTEELYVRKLRSLYLISDHWPSHCSMDMQIRILSGMLVIALGNQSFLSSCEITSDLSFRMILMIPDLLCTFVWQTIFGPSRNTYLTTSHLPSGISCC